MNEIEVVDLSHAGEVVVSGARANGGGGSRNKGPKRPRRASGERRTTRTLRIPRPTSDDEEPKKKGRKPKRKRPARA